MYNKIILKNGIRVVYKKMESLKSVSIGYWFRVGSINETKENSGVSHFIEHMLFKETKNRTAKDISGEIDELGGEINAFTSKECTCFYARVLGEHLENAVDILSDMTVNSIFSEEEINKERKNYVEGEVLVKFKEQKINLEQYSGRVKASQFAIIHWPCPYLELKNPWKK